MSGARDFVDGLEACVALVKCGFFACGAGCLAAGGIAKVCATVTEPCSKELSNSLDTWGNDCCQCGADVCQCNYENDNSGYQRAPEQQRMF